MVSSSPHIRYDDSGRQRCASSGSPPRALGTAESWLFEELVGVLNGISVALWKTDDFVETAEEALAAFRAQDYQEKILLVAIEDGVVVGRVQADFPIEEEAETVSLLVDGPGGARPRHRLGPPGSR
ncbi:hypothetical protein ACRAWC_02075 [Leifsonia sp. L25]|uniref:hypothetical protein n=1 Tax=Leifsonia sp. L25 TaxID=3423957 RepID=UPI003D695B6F